MNEKQQFNLRLERYLLGELPLSEMKRIAAELKQNSDLRRQLETLRHDTEKYFLKYPNLRSQRAPHAVEQTQWWAVLFAPRLIGGLAFAAAVIGFVLFLPKTQSEKTPIASEKKQENVILAMKENVDENSVRTKGNTSALLLSTIRNAQKISLADGDAVRPGEEIQIAYRASGNRYGVIVSIDAEKSVTLHFPENERAPQDLKSGNIASLPLAFKLDEKPGFEKFYFLASPKPIPLRQVMSGLAKSGNIGDSIGKDVQRTSLQLRKE